MKDNSEEYFTDEATAAFIRKTLCPQKIQATGYLPEDGPSTVTDVLPPLTSSNHVDLQLYAFIAIIVRDNVQPWYQKITPDQIFLDEVIQIIAHCTRALEQRLRKVDVEALLLDELPALLDAHVTGDGFELIPNCSFKRLTERHSASISRISGSLPLSHDTRQCPPNLPRSPTSSCFGCSS